MKGGDGGVMEVEVAVMESISWEEGKELNSDFSYFSPMEPIS